MENSFAYTPINHAGVYMSEPKKPTSDTCGWVRTAKLKHYNILISFGNFIR
jgi:hypothetical protein